MYKSKFLYIAGVYCSQFFHVVLNMLFMKFFSAEQLGHIAIAKVWLQSASFGHIGTRYSIDRYGPVVDYKTSVIISLLSLAVNTIAILGLLIAAIFVSGDPIVISFLIAGAVISHGAIIKAYYRAKGDTNGMAKVALLFNCIPLSIIVLSLWFLNLFSYLALYCLPYLVVAVICFVKYRWVFYRYLKFKLLWGTFKKTFATSGVLFLNALVIFLYRYVDRVVIEQFLGAKVLGEYSVILFIFGTLQVVPGVCGEFVLSKVTKHANRTGKIFFIKEINMVICLTLLAIVLANGAMSFYISNFTRYAHLLPQMYILSIAILPYCATVILYHALVGCDLKRQILYSHIGVLLTVAAGVLYGVVSKEMNLSYFVWLKFSLGFVLLFFYTGVAFSHSRQLTYCVVGKKD